MRVGAAKVAVLVLGTVFVLAPSASAAAGPGHPAHFRVGAAVGDFTPPRAGLVPQGRRLVAETGEHVGATETRGELIELRIDVAEALSDEEPAGETRETDGIHATRLELLDVQEVLDAEGGHRE